MADFFKEVFDDSAHAAERRAQAGRKPWWQLAKTVRQGYLMSAGYFVIGLGALIVSVTGPGSPVAPRSSQCCGWYSVSGAWSPRLPSAGASTAAMNSARRPRTAPDCLRPPDRRRTSRGNHRRRRSGDRPFQTVGNHLLARSTQDDQYRPWSGPDRFACPLRSADFLAR
jgi:hypothetical protein